MKRKYFFIVVLVLVLLLLVAFYIHRLSRKPISADQVTTGQHFPSLRTFGMFLNNSIHKPGYAEWASKHLDALMGNRNVTGHDYFYYNFTDTSAVANDANTGQDVFDTVYENFVRQQNNFENIFLHYNHDFELLIPTNKHYWFKTDKLSRVYLGEQEITSRAYGDDRSLRVDSPFETAYADSATNSLWLGHIDRFATVNINISTAASSDWEGVWRYWNGSEWHDLTLTSDTTAGQQTKGAISFVPPSDWVRTNYQNHNQYWIRLDRVSTDGVGPHFQTLVTAPGVNELRTAGIALPDHQVVSQNGQSYYQVRGWNLANDLNNDGYVDDSEWENRVDPTASARFLYQARALCNYYTIGRWLINPADPNWPQAIAEVARQGIADGVTGIFSDNSRGYLSDLWAKDGSSATYLEYAGNNQPHIAYMQATGLLMSRFATAIAPLSLVTNNNLSSTVMEQGGDGIFLEGFLQNTGRDVVTFDPTQFAFYQKRVKQLADINKFAVLQFRSDEIFTDDQALSSLALYYLLKQDNSYYSNSDSAYGRAPDYWFDAIATDLGTPTEEAVRHTLSTPSPAEKNVVKNGSFEEGVDSQINDWSCVGGDITCNIDGSQSKDGSKSLKISRSTFGGSGYEGQSLPALKPNTVYTLHFWMKTQDLVVADPAKPQQSAQVYVSQSPAAAAGQAFATAYPGSSDWQYMTTVFKTAATITEAKLAISFVSAQGTVWVDDVHLLEGSYPSYDVFTRKYTKGIALLDRGSSHPEFPTDQAFPTSFDLGGNYNTLNKVGSVTAATTSVPLNGPKGSILLTSQPPVIAPINDIVLQPRQTLDQVITVADPENAEVTVTTPVLPEGAEFIQQNDGYHLRWSPPVSANSSEKKVAIQANSGSEQSQYSFNITVLADQPPTFVSQLDQTSKVGQNLDLLISTTDPENDAVTVTADTLPSGAELINREGSYYFTWTPTSSQAGKSHQIVLTASDGVAQSQTTANLVIDPIKVTAVYETTATANKDIVIGRLSANGAIPTITIDGVASLASVKGQMVTIPPLSVGRHQIVVTDETTGEAKKTELTVYPSRKTIIIWVVAICAILVSVWYILRRRSLQDSGV